jgi:tRNA 2-thiouridine synthesizing protein A
MSVKILDAKGLKCPMPIIKAKKEIDAMSPGDLLEVHATDPGSVADFQGWSKTSKTASLKDQLTASGSDGKTVYIHVLERK